LAPQLLRCSGGQARDPSSLEPQMAQVGLRWDFGTTVVQVLRWPGTGSVVTGTSGGSGGAQVEFLHLSCLVDQVTWHGILRHWYLRWLRWQLRSHNKAPEVLRFLVRASCLTQGTLPTSRWHLPYSVSFLALEVWVQELLFDLMH
jgi:hypothetical protein